MHIENSPKSDIDQRSIVTTGGESPLSVIVDWLTETNATVVADASHGHTKLNINREKESNIIQNGGQNSNENNINGAFDLFNNSPKSLKADNTVNIDLESPKSEKKINLATVSKPYVNGTADDIGVESDDSNSTKYELIDIDDASENEVIVSSIVSQKDKQYQYKNQEHCEVGQIINSTLSKPTPINKEALVEKVVNYILTLSTSPNLIKNSVIPILSENYCESIVLNPTLKLPAPGLIPIEVFREAQRRLAEERAIAEYKYTDLKYAKLVFNSGIINATYRYNLDVQEKFDLIDLEFKKDSVSEPETKEQKVEEQDTKSTELEKTVLELAAKIIFRDKYSMGFDIFSRLRKLLGFNSNSNSSEENNQTNSNTINNNSRKRSATSVPDASEPTIKYRRVENEFPKYYSTTGENDFLGEATINGGNNMSERINSAEGKPKHRKSIFAPPQVLHTIVENPNCIEIDLSEDDDNPTENIVVQGSGNMWSMPVNRRQLGEGAVGQQPIPPALYDPQTGNMLSSSSESLSAPKRKPLSFNDAARPNAGENTKYELYSRSTTTISSTADSNVATGRVNSIRSSVWNSNAHTIIAQEKDSEEHEQYQRLLEEVMPTTYCSIGTNALPRKLSVSGGGATTSKSKSSPITKKRNRNFHLTLTRTQLDQKISTVNLVDDDDDEDGDKITIIDVDDDSGDDAGAGHNNQSSINVVINLTDDDNDGDDGEADVSIVGEYQSDIPREYEMAKPSFAATSSAKKSADTDKTSSTTLTMDQLPHVEPVNSLQERFNRSKYIGAGWIEAWQKKWDRIKKDNKDVMVFAENKVHKLSLERRTAEFDIHDRLREITLDTPRVVVEEVVDLVQVAEVEFVPLNEQRRARIKEAVCGPLEKVLVSKFNLHITRRDILTLLGHSWLNDEVINFYMNLLTDRSERRSDRLPSVYAMNTFFVPRLIQAGHTGVKRWTRKVDIFSKDIIPVPVHVGGVHWCMAIIHLKNRSIKYYDSMGKPNPIVLSALETYLRDESLDKRRQAFDMKGFVIESVKNVPHQLNGSDCGVFSCMFAEYITRNKNITFTQDHMEYFRHKMIYEIVQGELLQ